MPIMPVICLPSRMTLLALRLNIRQAATEDPRTMDRCLEMQAYVDGLGSGGCYDIARPDLAAGKSA